jgi:hypothetical protein
MKIFLQELIVIKNKNLQRFKWRGFYVQYFVRTKNDLGRTLVFLALVCSTKKTLFKNYA